MSCSFHVSNRTEPHFPVLRDDVVDLTDCYQYEDNQTDNLDAFAREPYILHFKPHNTGESALLDLRTDTIDTSLWREVETDPLLCCKDQTGLSGQSRL